MIGRTNAEIPGSDNVTTVTLSSGNTGVTVTATGNGRTKTAITDSNGQAVFKHLELGYNWTFSAEGFSLTVYLGDLTVDVLLGARPAFIKKVSYTSYPPVSTQRFKIGLPDPNSGTGFASILAEFDYNEYMDSTVLNEFVSISDLDLTGGTTYRVSFGVRLGALYDISASVYVNVDSSGESGTNVPRLSTSQYTQGFYDFVAPAGDISNYCFIITQS